MFPSMSRQVKGPYSKSSALLMWLAWIFGFGGIHRIYLGKPITGILYLATWGLFGVGQVIDLLTMGSMVDEANRRELGGRAPKQLTAGGGFQHIPRAPVGDPTEMARLKLLQAAKNNGNQLSVTQGVMATGKTFKEVEAMLDEMAKSGYVGIGNHESTGAVVYTFGELG
jgi:TM2 domain-containing membrane protein YozV